MKKIEIGGRGKKEAAGVGEKGGGKKEQKKRQSGRRKREAERREREVEIQWNTEEKNDKEQSIRGMKSERDAAEP